VSACWFLREPAAASTFVIGGKYGDICQMLGAFHALYERNGLKPNVISSTDFSSIYDGCSYLNVMPIRAHWYSGLTQMKQIAIARWGDAECLQFWHDMKSPEFQSARFPGGIVLQSHGVNFAVDMSKDPDYGTSMMRRAGFSREEMMKLAPVFDRRNPAREQDLLNKLWPVALRKKPLVAYTFTGQSSPFGFMPEIWPTIQAFAKDFHYVDLGKVQAHRVYDMLGVIEASRAVITCDTLLLHMMPATRTPYIAFTVDGWTSSVPKGNVALHVKYNETPRRLQEVRAVLERWRDSPRLEPLPDDGRQPPAPSGGSNLMAHAAVAGLARGRRRIGAAFR
jgi:hypothetical protein